MNSVSRSDRLIGAPLLGEDFAEQHPDLGFGTAAIGLRQRFEIQAPEQLAVNVGPQLQVLGPGCQRNRAVEALVGDEACGRTAAIGFIGLPHGRQALDAEPAAFCCLRRSRDVGIDDAAA